MQPVLERLILSDLSEANDPFFLKMHEIQAIMYFGEGGMFGDDIKLYHEPVPSGNLTKEHLRTGIDFLRESLRAGRRVLAVGQTGATIVAAYLVEMGFSDAQALQMTGQGRNPRPDAECIAGHQAELKRRASITLAHR